jgi:hypothetical protein
MIFAADQEREAYLDLKQRYRFLYGMGLQERLRDQGEDIVHWWEMGRKACGPIPVNPAKPALVEPAPERGPPRWADLPERVREIIRAVAQERGVTAADIVGYRKTGRIADARQECYRRLRAMSWPGGQPSLMQIGVWLHRDHTTVMHGVNKR